MSTQRKNPSKLKAKPKTGQQIKPALKSDLLKLNMLVETLGELTRVINMGLDLEQVLEFILDQLAKVVSYDSASIMLLKEGELSLAAQRKFRSPDQQNFPLQVDRLLHIQEVLEKRHSVVIPDTQKDTRWLPIQSAPYIRCWLGVPLIEKNQVIGLLNLDKEQPGYYSIEDARLATTFANQAAIAIENTRLRDSERKQLEQLDALRATIADISTELELSKLMQSILERATKMLYATGGEVGIYDEKKEEIIILVSQNLGKDFTGTVLEKGEGIMGRAVQARQPMIVDDYLSWEGISPKYKEATIQSVLAVPFLIGNRVVGAIGIVDSRPERRFSTADQHLISLLAQHAAIAVENARLYQEARQAADRRAILHQVSQEIVAASQDPESIYTAIHRAATKLMPAEAFIITQYDEVRQAINAVYLVDRSGRVPPQIIPSDKGLSGRVITTGKAIYIEDITKDTHNIEAIHFGDIEQVRSLIAVPMRLHNKVVGMISAQSYRPDDYTSEDLTLLEMLASYAAIALDNAKLFLEIQQLAITDPLTQIFNRRQLFELGQRELNRACRFQRPLSVIMLDIDRFKNVNDEYGHAVGDYVLLRLAQLLRSSVRETDVVGRYGGEEFTIVLIETDAVMAIETALRIRERIHHTFQDPSRNFPSIKVSMGIAEATSEITYFGALVNQADAAMYQAKNAGGDRVEVYQTINMPSPKE